MNQRLREFIGLLNGFRKFTIILLVLITGIVFRSIDFVNGAEFVDLLKGSVVAYMAFNGVEHLTKTVTEWVKKKASS